MNTQALASGRIEFLEETKAIALIIMGILGGLTFSSPTTAVGRGL